MARLRTEEEKSAIVAHCLELERTGGDILGYLWSENYITPRATWCNFQREWLHRKPYEFTDGKPKQKKERKNMSRLVFTDEQKAEAVRIAIEGGSPLTYIAGLGAKSPASVWANIRTLYKQQHPDIFAKIPQHKQGWKAPKVDKGIPKQELQLEAGTNYEVSVAETPEAAVVEMTRKNPRTPKPAEVNGLMVTAVTHPDLGEWYFDRKFNSIDWRTPEGDEVSLPPSWWMMMMAELPNVLQALGVDV